MSRKKKSQPLITSLVLVWIVVLALAGGLLGANAMGVFELPTPLPLAAFQTVEPTLGALPATWTPNPATEIPQSSESVSRNQNAPGLSAIEATFTPINPFPPSPTYVFTPVPFSDGPIVIGESLGGRPIEVYRFGTGPVHRMLVAGIHGGYEWNTTALVLELIDYIDEHLDLIPHTVTLFIVVSLNPDGYARTFGIDGRVNDNGVDLNRNFPVNWSADWDRQRCWNFAPTSSGNSPASEPETQVLIDFVKNHTHVTALISYHSAALGIFPGGEPPHAPSVRLAEAIAAVSTYPYPPIDIGCFYTGTLADWASDEGIASVDLELHTHVLTDFEENLEILKMFLEWRR